MKIYNPQGTQLYDISVNDSSVRYRSIMTDDSLTLNFAHTGVVSIPRLSYVEFEGSRYTLWHQQEFKKHGTRNHEYTLTLHGYREFLKFVKFKDMSAVPHRLKFSLTAKTVVFLQNLVACLNDNDPAHGWTAGDCVDAPEKTLSFNHEFCIDVLNRMSQEWQTEFEFEGKTIHLRKVEKFKADPLALSYGKGNGFLPGVGRYNEGDRQPVGKLFVQGGERNIDYSTYNSKSLLLPKSQTLVVDGKTYRTDADGMYITRDDGTNTAEDSYDASSIYPKRVGTVSEVVVVDAEKHFYDIKDSSIPEALNYRDCRIAGEKAIIKFESGALAGREFDIEQTDSDLTGYTHAERRFKIVPQELDGIIMPGGAFVPAVGDKYAVFNISMPAAYISDNATQTGASWDMFREAVRYFAENETERFRFTGELDGIWSKSRWLEIGGKIVPGGHVLFSDTQFQPAGVVIRIVAVKDYVNKPHKPEITLSNAPVAGSFSSGMAKLEADEVVIEESKKEVLRFTRRQWRDARETMEMLNASLQNFSGSINPLTVKTMQLIAGDESLQFWFVNGKTNPQPVSHDFVFNPQNKQLSTAAGIIQHMTLGITTLSTAAAPKNYKFWDVEAYTSPALAPEKAYYFYAKCAKTGTAGTFLLSETAVAIEAVSGYYHFLVGILNSENAGDRSFAPLYGYTEILPGRVTTNKIVSQDGKTYFDLLRGIIGGKITFLSSGGAEEDLGEWAAGTSQDIQDAQGAATAAAQKAQQAIEAAAANVTDYNAKFAAQQAQIDGEISNWFYPFTPTLTNYPASEWSTNEIRDRHIGDTFTNTQQAPATDAGKSWRFIKNGTTYSWTPIADSDAVLALQRAAQAQATADGKSTTFLVQPTFYKIGDTWVLGADIALNGKAYKQGDILTATQDSASFNAAHWIKRVRYTDDTAVENLRIGSRNLLLNTKGVSCNSQYNIATFNICIDKPEGGEQVTIAFEGEMGEGKTHWGLYNTDGNHFINKLTNSDRGSNGIYEKTFSWRINGAANTKLKVYAFPLSVTAESLIENVMLVRGNKITYYQEAPEDVQERIDKAKQEALNAAAAAQTSADNANSALDNLNNYVDGAFRDGLIDSSEAKAIEKYINIINTEKEGLEATYNKLYLNTYLESTAKATLLNAKITYFGAVDSLLSSINVAIEDGTTTVSEKQHVDAKYNEYKTFLTSLHSAIEEANRAIQEKLDELSTQKVDNLIVGNRNFFISKKILFYGGKAEFTDSGIEYTIAGQERIVTEEGIFEENTEYTLMYTLEQKTGKNHRFRIEYVDGSYKDLLGMYINGKPFTTPKNKTVLRVRLCFSSIGVVKIINPVFVKGNKPMSSWIEAPEDVQERIIGAKIDAETASKDYTNDAIKRMKIGGVNLLDGTTSEYKSITIKQYGNTRPYFVNVDKHNLATGDKVTLSLFVKDIPPQQSICLRLDSLKDNNEYTAETLYSSATHEDGFVKATFTIKDVSLYKRIRFRIMPIKYTSDFNINICKEQLEIGDKETSWKVSQDDVQASIDAAVSAVSYWEIDASAALIYKDSPGVSTPGVHTAVNVRGVKRQGASNIPGAFITVTANGDTEAQTASPGTISIAPSNDSGKKQYVVRLYDTAQKTNLLDTMTIPVVFRGASGVNALNVVLNNEVDVLPAAPDGTVLDYSYSGTSIRVFEGALELVFDDAGKNAGKYKVIASGQGIDPGVIQSQGIHCVTSDASNMNAEAASITYTISGKTFLGESFSLTKKQSFAKAKKGDAGVSNYTHIRYSQKANGNPMTTDPEGAKYIGISVTQTPSAPSSYSQYKWSLVKGVDGLPGNPGINGKTSYLHIKYSNDGGQTFTDGNGETLGEWIGIYVDFVQSDSNNPADYTWNKIKGQDGAPGPKGDGVLIRYKRSATRPAKPADTDLNPAGWLVVPNKPDNVDIYDLSFAGDWILQTNGEWKSKTITHSEKTAVRVKFRTCQDNAVIKITARVSSEANYDKLHIGKIDTELGNNYVDELKNISGTKTEELSYTVSAKGEHFVDFEYKKDFGGSSGDDAAYISVSVPVKTVWVTTCAVASGAGCGWSEPLIYLDERIEDLVAKTYKSAAITDKFGTDHSGALIQTVMILLRELNSQAETAGTSGIQGDGSLPAIWAGGSYAQAIANLAKIILRHDGSGQLAGGNVRWDSDGNIGLKGSVRSAFSYAPYGSNIEYNDNVAIISAAGSWEDEYSLQWDVLQSGRRITIVNWKWGTKNANEYADITAPSGKYFFRNGGALSILRIWRDEVVELLGYGTPEEFYGWIVTNITYAQTFRTAGGQVRVLAVGTVTGSSYGASFLGYKTFDDSTLTVSRREEGKYRISFPASWSFVSRDPKVMLTGYGYVGGNTAQPVKATLVTRTSSYIDVMTSADASAADGGFEFLIISSAFLGF